MRTICVVCTNIETNVHPRRFTHAAATSIVRTARLGLRATLEQETVLRRATEVAHKSLTDFILDAAYQAAEQTLLDQRLFMVSGNQYQALLEMLDRPESDNLSLADLFSRRPVWAMSLSAPQALDTHHRLEELWKAYSHRLAAAPRTPSPRQRLGKNLCRMRWGAGCRLLQSDRWPDRHARSA